MSSIPDLVTVRDPRASVWQSMVERVALRRERVANQEKGAAPKFLAGMTTRILRTGVQTPLRDLVKACHAHVFEAEEMKHGRVPLSSPLSMSALADGVREVSGFDKAKRCSALAARLAAAKVFGTAAEVQSLQNALNFNVCDPFWAECVTEYVAFYKAGSGTIPYRPGLNNMLSDKVTAQAKIAIFGDWGTGTEAAHQLLSQIKEFNPDFLVHLGDIYYSGTQNEVQERFLDICQDIFDSSMPRRFSLCGNHDVYSGGAGYYWLVDQLGQNASYFAIQNDDWLFIGMDTGKHDFNPLQGGSAATFLETTEADWVNQLISSSTNQKIVLFSHHPLFSAYEPIGGEAINTVLLSQFQPSSLAKITAWFWGHEHRLGVYDKFQGLARGRCLGHAAVPVFTDDTGDPPKLSGVPVHIEGGQALDMGSDKGIFKHGFAIIELNDKIAKTSYYRAGEFGPVWQESF